WELIVAAWCEQPVQRQKEGALRERASLKDTTSLESAETGIPGGAQAGAFVPTRFGRSAGAAIAARYHVKEPVMVERRIQVVVVGSVEFRRSVVGEAA